jgi:hypothetical protein
VWVFGDKHDITFVCPKKNVTIRRLEHIVMDEAPRVNGMIDVFLEHERPSAEQTETLYRMTSTVNNYLTLFQLALLGCWRQCQTSCYVKNLRFHSVDARKFRTAYLMIYESCASLLYDKKPRTKAQKRELVRQLDPRLLQNVRDGLTTYADSPELTVKDVITYHITSSKAMKQVEKISSEEERRIVMDMVVTQPFKKYKKVLDIKLQDVLASIDASGDTLLFDFMDGFAEVGMIPMDLYAMARFLSTFKDGSSPTRSLFFVGWVHARIYEKILKALNFRRVWMSPRRRDGLPESMDHYLDVSGAPQPFLE